MVHQPICMSPWEEMSTSYTHFPGKSRVRPSRQTRPTSDPATGPAAHAAPLYTQVVERMVPKLLWPITWGEQG